MDTRGEWIHVVSDTPVEFIHAAIGYTRRVDDAPAVLEEPPQQRAATQRADLVMREGQDARELDVYVVPAQRLEPRRRAGERSIAPQSTRQFTPRLYSILTHRICRMRNEK